MSDSDPLVVLTVALRHLHRRAGEPSTRTIGKAINYSHTTIANVLKGRRCPGWLVLKEIVVYLEGNVDEFRKLWIDVRQDSDPLPMLAAGVNLSNSDSIEATSGDYKRAEGRAISQAEDLVEVSLDRGQGTPGLKFVLPSAVAWSWFNNLSGEEGADGKG